MAFIGCSAWFGPDPLPPDRSEVRAHLTGNFPTAQPNLSGLGVAHPTPNASVQAVRFEVAGGFPVAGALWTPASPSGVGVVVAHGHYGQGKSSAESQEIAHRLAARGAWVLAIDSPGVEEGDTPQRQIHFSEGAHNRGLLVAGGSSALALQMAGLQAAVSALGDLGAERIGVTGASGGAVASFYLAWIDERVGAAALAAPPPIPREAAASGCACDHVPGHPGPDAGVVAQLTVPSLWMADVESDGPAGLSRSAAFHVHEGPHSYTESMQRRAIEFFEDRLELPEGEWLVSVPNLSLSSGALPEDSMPIAELPLPGRDAWQPKPSTTDVAEVQCRGEGPVWLALGTEDVDDLVAADRRVCTVRMPAANGAQWDEAAWTESIGTGVVRADAVVGAVMAAARQHGAVGVWAHRVWGVVAGATGLPFAVTEPVRTPGELTIEDPAWVHVPGAWQGAVEGLLDQAVSTSTDRAILVDALKKATE